MRASVEMPQLSQPTAAAVAGTRTEIALAAELILTRRLILPESVARDLDSVVTLQLERECPIPVDQVLVDQRVAARLRQEQRIAVDVWMVRRTQIERLRELARAWGLSLTRIGLRDSDGGVAGNFLRAPARLKRMQLSALDYRLIVSAAALAGVCLGVIGFHWGYERVALGHELSRLRAPAAAAVYLAKQMETSAAPAQALVSLMKQPDALDAVGTLTDAIPKDSWVYDLDIVAQWPQVPRIKLSGFTPAATILVDLLGSSHKFDMVRLVSAQSAGLGSGLDRLQLTARLTARASATAALARDTRGQQ